MATFAYILSSPIGSLGLNTSAKGVTQLSYLASSQTTRTPRQGLAYEVKRQLQDYFDSKITSFELPLDVPGTRYQQQVWQLLQGISYGQYQTYGEIAQTLGSGARAVGNACRRNPIPIIIPCHRVVRADAVGGYCGSVSGRALQQKDWLLRHELGMHQTAASIHKGENV